MNVISKILNGLSFANVNNLGEFRALLRQTEQPRGAAQAPVQTVSAGAATVAAEFHHTQGAL